MTTNQPGCPYCTRPITQRGHEREVLITRLQARVTHLEATIKWLDKLVEAYESEVLAINLNAVSHSALDDHQSIDTGGDGSLDTNHPFA